MRSFLLFLLIFLQEIAADTTKQKEEKREKPCYVVFHMSINIDERERADMNG
jgi:hypothetical protein